MAKATYKDAGVDLEVYRDSMARLPRLLSRTFTPRVVPLKDGFAGLFQLDFTNQLFARRYKDPVLVSCTDGVGTKLKVAVAAGRHNTVGIDLVAMSVNDALCCGAEPLFFLDYVAMPKDDPVLLEQIVQGITDGCIQADCALLGGETAILPDMYAPGDYDLAGFCVGVAEKDRVIDGRSIELDDVVIGVASSGLHSNGFSLARKIAFDIGGYKIDDHVEELGQTVGDALLAPTRIYVRPIRQILTYYRVKNVVHGIAHITGGGAARKPRAHLARDDSSRDRSRQLADSAGVFVASAFGRGRSSRDGPGFQHGHWVGAHRRTLLRREHSPSALPRRSGQLGDRPRSKGAEERGVGLAGEGLAFGR